MVDIYERGLDESLERAMRDERSLGKLFRKLADESSDLIRAEIALAKLELSETITTAASSLVKLILALAFAGIGGVTLVVFMILGLGELLGAYWAGALITGLLLSLAGGLLAWRAARAMSRTGVDETVRTLKEDKEWAAEELRQLRGAASSVPHTSEGASP